MSADIGKLEKVAGEAADKLMQAVEKYGPHAVDMTLEVGRVAAIQALFWSVVGLVCLGAAIWFGRISARNFPDLDGIPAAVAAMFLAFMGVPMFATNFSAFAIVGLFQPEIYLAAKLLNL